MFLNSVSQKEKDIHTHIKVICEEKNLPAVCLSAEVVAEYPV
jgi:hypothetical protein